MGILWLMPIAFAIMAAFFIYYDLFDDKYEEERKGLKKANEDSEEEENEWKGMFKNLELLSDEQLRASKRRLRATNVSYGGFADNIREIYIIKIDTILNMRAEERTRKQILNMRPVEKTKRQTLRWQQ
jgi:hypothetical protein